MSNLSTNKNLMSNLKRNKQQSKINIFIDQLPGAQRDNVEIEDDEGHGAAMLSVKSQVKLKPVELSNTTSEGRLRRRHPIIFGKE